MTGVPSTSTVRAIKELTALKVVKETFFQLVGEVPEMAMEIMRELARRLERTTAELQRARSVNS